MTTKLTRLKNTNRWTSVMVGLPILIYTSYVLYERGEYLSVVVVMIRFPLSVSPTQQPGDFLGRLDRQG